MDHINELIYTCDFQLLVRGEIVFCNKPAVYENQLADDEGEDMGIEMLCEDHCPAWHPFSSKYMKLESNASIPDFGKPKEPKTEVRGF